MEWSICNPYTENTSYLNSGEALPITFEAEYGSGIKRACWEAQRATQEVQINDIFELRKIEIASLQALSDSVSEFVVMNNMDYGQYFDWRFDSGITNLYSENTININDEDVFVFMVRKVYFINGLSTPFWT